MAKNGPIILIEDDTDDQYFFKEALKGVDVKNEVKIFEGRDVIEYLMSTKDSPFIIFSDINLPGANGLQIKSAINENFYLKRKTIPFVFYTTTNDASVVEKAYRLPIEGFFQKPTDLEQMRTRLKLILQYWEECLHPNS